MSQVTLQEIMQEIQEKYPHSLPNDSIIRKLDALQKRIFRVYRKLVMTSYKSAPGQKWYDETHFGKLIRPSDIREFLVDGVSYPYRDIEEEPLPTYFFYIDGKYGIVPLQPANTDILVMHYKTPATLTTLSVGVEIDEEYQNILVYGVCKEVAEIYHDFDVANGFAVQYNDFFDELLKHNKPVEPHRIKEEWWR